MAAHSHNSHSLILIAKYVTIATTTKQRDKLAVHRLLTLLNLNYSGSTYCFRYICASGVAHCTSAAAN